jgi:glycosyltransferase involved in cell wall biosynthesis
MLMKLAYIIENYGVPWETFITDLINGLSATGVEGVVLCDRIWDEASMPPCGFDIREIGLTSKWGGGIWRAGKVAEKFGRSEFREEARRWVAKRQLLSALPAVKPDAAFVEYGPNAILARESLSALGIPFVVHFHGYDASRWLAVPWYAEQIKKVFHDARAVLVPSNHLRRRLIIAGCPAEKVHAIHHGIASDRTEPVDWTKLQDQPPSIIHLGSLVEKKSPIPLLHALRLVQRRLPEARLTIVGAGPCADAVAKAVNDLGLRDSVRLLGAMEHADALREMRRGHWICAQHSATAPDGDQEGFSISLLEAAALGLPVVSTIHDGIPENVIDGKTGYLVPEWDYEAMADRLIALLENPDVARRMGQTGRDLVLRERRFELRVDRIRELLEDIGERPGGTHRAAAG